MRRAWNTHAAQKQVFDPPSAEMSQLSDFNDMLGELCAEPSATATTSLASRPSRRQQLVKLRDTMRATLKNVDAKLDSIDAEVEETDPVIERARAAARERLKLPIHLRGNAVLNVAD